MIPFQNCKNLNFHESKFPITPNLWVHTGSCNNLDADFGSWTQDAGICIIGLHRLDSTSAAGDGLAAISGVVVIYGIPYNGKFMLQCKLKMK
jgi:hypothetical protein